MSPTLPLALALVLALAALGLWLAFRLVSETRARSQARARYLDDVKPLFDGGEARLQPTGFPRMTGRQRGLSFDLQVIPDTLTFRKLPALWVLVSVPESLPLKATLDLMARPAGNEPFSTYSALPQSLPGPAGLPTDVGVRSDDALQILPAADVIARHMDLFNDPQIKELVLSPKGLRIVFLAEEADRGRYLLFRDAEMGRAPLDPSRLSPILDRLRAIREDVLVLLTKETP